MVLAQLHFFKQSPKEDALRMMGLGNQAEFELDMVNAISTVDIKLLSQLRAIQDGTV